MISQNQKQLVALQKLHKSFSENEHAIASVTGRKSSSLVMLEYLIAQQEQRVFIALEDNA